MTLRSLSTATLLFICAGLVAAQGKWVTFHATADAFSIQTPFPLTQDGGKSQEDSRRYYASDEHGTYLYVFSDPAKEAHQIAQIVEFAKSQGAVISVAKPQSSPLHFKDEFGYWHTIASANAGSRIFIVQAVSSDEDSPLAKRFVSTFKAEVMDTAPPGPLTEAPPAETIVGSLEPLKPDETGPGIGSGKGVGSGSGFGTRIGNGSGIGTGTGNGSGVGNGALRPPPPVGNRTLRILSKPRPAYTELGRLYQITGKVVLSVPFLETGKIGVVSVVKGLPFGLTHQAVVAARRMAFDSPLKDGQPVSITKQVEYNFNIY
jgi:hypothetical protein